MDAKKTIEKIVNDPNYLKNLSDKDFTDVVKKIQPFMVPEKGEAEYINMSIVNLREEYATKLLFTSLIGYLYRLAYEYDVNNHRVKDDKLSQKEIDQRRVIVKEFLDYTFEFDPDRHVRSAHLADPDDPEREALEKAKEKMKVKKPKHLDKVVNKEKICKELILTNYNTIGTILDSTAGMLKAHKYKNSIKAADYEGILTKQYKNLTKLRVGLQSTFDVYTKYDTSEALEHVPSIDVFHNFKRYHDSNYEQLRFATRSLYNDKPDLEFMIKVYPGLFKEEQEAIDWKIKNEKTLQLDVLTISTRETTFLGPFKENRDRVDFYNKNLSVLKGIQEQNVKDAKVANEMAVAKAKRSKVKNIKEQGPSAPGLDTYSKLMGTVNNENSQTYLSEEEEKKAVKAYEDMKTESVLKANDDLPDDAVQLDIHKNEIDEDGNHVYEKVSVYVPVSGKKE